MLFTRHTLLFLFLTIIVGCAINPEYRTPSPLESGSRLGTLWGEGLQASARKVNLRRETSEPISTIQINYSSTPIQGVAVTEVMLADGRVGFSILNDKGQKIILKQQGSQIHLQGKEGERYDLFYRNYNKNIIYEIIATVDGLDVVNGMPGSFRNPGYALYPEQSLTISGFRKNSEEVAAFRFAKSRDTYAANTKNGDVRNIGVIGTAVFTLKDPNNVTRSNQNLSSKTVVPNAFPNEQEYAPTPRYNH